MRRPREVVAPHVDKLVSQMLADNPGLEIHVGGSWRREAPMVGDVDLLVITDHPLTPNLFEPGVVLPAMVTWQRAGPRIANGDVAMPDGFPLHIDLWQAPPQARGAMQCFVTGSQETNLRMRSRAKASGLALSQDGLTDRATGQQLDDGTEHHIFELLRMPWIPPRDR